MNELRTLIFGEFSQAQQHSLSQILVITLLSVTAFIFRESSKTAQRWGAFAGEGLTRRNLLLKLAGSIVLLGFFPLVMLAFSWQVAEVFPVKHLWEVLLYVGFVIVMGLFPRGMKHVWLLIARAVGWVGKENKVPLVVYSLQVIVLCVMIPLAICYYRFIRQESFVSGKDLWPKLFLIGYVAEMITLYQIDVDKLFFERKEQWITSFRMIRSLLWTVFLPLIFGMFALGCVSGFRPGGRTPAAYIFPEKVSVWSWEAILSFFVIFVFLALPYGFSQTWLLVARRWPGQHAYIAEGEHPWWWKTGVVFIVVPSLTAACIWLWF